ncbi:hypothetical protein CsSME_00025364 [Camellia sinensis var. sinensis]
MDDQDLEVEKARLISLALEFGFDEESAIKCLDRFVNLYGDDGQDFISVELCGDDFLVALAESMQGSEDWDDLQAMESEDILNNYEEENNDKARSYLHVIEDSSDGEDLDFIIPSKKDVGSTPSSVVRAASLKIQFAIK